MEHVLVRYSEIGTKSPRVRQRMLARLRSRLAERLAYDDIPYDTINHRDGRLIVHTLQPSRVARALSEVPGVRSTSPAIHTTSDLDRITLATDALHIGDSFGVRTHRTGDHPYTSMEVSQHIGTHIQAQTDTPVDLDAPDTWVEIEIRHTDAYVFTTRHDGPGGFPVGTQGTLAALISGGIDSPVAAHQVLTRGCDIYPVYYYNKPHAAGDHVLRFEAALTQLVRFHPAKNWTYALVDMEHANDALLRVGRGRMLLHRAIMFRVADHIATTQGHDGIVTGEAIGQKSSQTTPNLSLTTRQTRTPVYRPLLTWPKERIVEHARLIGTFEHAQIDSACRTIAPDRPATKLTQPEFEDLATKVDIDHLVERTIETIQHVSLEGPSPGTRDAHSLEERV